MNQICPYNKMPISSQLIRNFQVIILRTNRSVSFIVIFTNSTQFMAAQQILQLLDSFWFEHEILSGKLYIPSSSSSSTIPILDDQEQQNLELEKRKLSEIAIFQVRSMSDRCLRLNCTGFSSDVASPTSFLSTPSPEKVKEIGDLSQSGEEQRKIQSNNIKKKVGNKRRRLRRRISRSLSELEYQELKGFMDLGFVFTEEDKTSSLVSILPGLQRWGKKENDDDDEEEAVHDKCYRVSRPYLSEAWDGLNQRKVNNKPLVNWKIPGPCNENNMKNHLKAWAHTVASSVL